MRISYIKGWKNEGNLKLVLFGLNGHQALDGESSRMVVQHQRVAQNIYKSSLKIPKIADPNGRYRCERQCKLPSERSLGLIHLWDARSWVLGYQSPSPSSTTVCFFSTSSLWRCLSVETLAYCPSSSSMPITSYPTLLPILLSQAARLALLVFARILLSALPRVVLIRLDRIDKCRRCSHFSNAALHAKIKAFLQTQMINKQTNKQQEVSCMPQG